MNILVIQNSMLDPIGVLGESLEKQGANLWTWLPEQQTSPPIGDFDGLIILGGPMNAHEDNKYPHLSQAVDLIHHFNHDNKPIMGVCLGAQLVARAFGSHVSPHRVPELGFSPLKAIDNRVEEPWLQNCSPDLHLMQWHFDTFDLPAQATLLMTNDICQNQAYRIGSNIYGFQFHLEVTPEIVLSWLSAKSVWIDTHYPHLDQQIKEQLQIHIQQSAQFADQVAQFWINLMSKPAVLSP